LFINVDPDADPIDFRNANTPQRALFYVRAKAAEYSKRGCGLAAAPVSRPHNGR
jgi:hypothetical protein